MTTFVAGLGLGLSLIVAIGAQNVFVLRQGLQRRFVAMVVAICALSDALLICAGVAGFGRIVEAAPQAIEVATWAGVAFLVVYGALAARRAIRPSDAALRAGSQERALPSRWAVALACLGFTWLNPHVYLDTVFLLGSISSSYDQPWIFGAGAVAGSVLWFSALGWGASRLAPLLATPRAWRILDGMIAVTMWVIAAMLAFGS